MKGLLKTVGIIVGIVILAFITFTIVDALTPKMAVVFFDNGFNNKTVTLKIDFKEPITIKGHEILKKEVKSGKHKVEIFDDKNKLTDNMEIDCKEATLGSKNKYVYNIKTANKYETYTMSYFASDYKPTAKDNAENPLKKTPNQHFFDLYTFSSMDLCEPFPKEVELTKGTQKTTKTVVMHSGILLHKNFPCCKALWESFK